VTIIGPDRATDGAGGDAGPDASRLRMTSGAGYAAFCACYALMKLALTAQTERSAGLERTVLRTEHPRA
jgi:hypothetical protein